LARSRTGEHGNFKTSSVEDNILSRVVRTENHWRGNAFLNMAASMEENGLLCPCRLSKEDVLDLDRRDRVPLLRGYCQNPRADGADGVCGMALGKHSVIGS
jgi:hypothetical protein